MSKRRTTRSTVNTRYFSTTAPTPTVLRDALRVPRSGRNPPQNRPWLDPPPTWPGPQTEWAIYWYLSVRGIEPGRRKLRPNQDYLYQGGLAAPGLFASKPFTRGDFVIFNRGQGRRGLVLDPITPFTHPTPWFDLRKRSILALMGWQVVFIDAERLTSFPGTVIERAFEGVDESRLGRTLGKAFG